MQKTVTKNPKTGTTHLEYTTDNPIVGLLVLVTSLVVVVTGFIFFLPILLLTMVLGLTGITVNHFWDKAKMKRRAKKYRNTRR